MRKTTGKPALLLAMLMLVLAPMTVSITAKAAPQPTTGITQDNFDAKRYADTYADLKKAFGYDEAKLWQHYQQFGIKEGRQVYNKSGTAASATPTATSAGLTQANFDAKRYADTYADLKKAFGYDEAKLWQHYQQFGIKEGRQVYTKSGTAASATPATAAKTQVAPAATSAGLTQANFDYKRYADTYADLKKAFGYDAAKLWQHYQQFGIKEGRQAFATVTTTPTTTAVAPAQGTNNFLSKEGGYQIAEYLKSCGIPYDLRPLWNPGTYQSFEEVNDINYNPLHHPEEDGGWEIFPDCPAGWKATMISFTL